MKQLLWLTFLFPLLSFAQECKYTVDKYDKFLKINKKEKDVKLSGLNAFGNNKLELTFCKYDTTVFFRIDLKLNSSMVVGRSDGFYFLLEDETVIKAYPQQIYSSSFREYKGNHLLANYLFLESDAIKALSKSKVKSVRIYHNSVYTEIDIKDKFQEDFNKVVKCFL